MASVWGSTDDSLLSLDRIRSILTRLEDTIIFSLIERAQFAHNPKIYRKGEFQELKDNGFEGSWLDWFLKETETFHGEPHRSCRNEPHTYSNSLCLAKARRFTRYVRS